MKKIVVEVGYQDFKFDGIDEAIKFAETANKTIQRKDRNNSITVTITFEKEEADAV